MKIKNKIPFEVIATTKACTPDLMTADSRVHANNCEKSIIKSCLDYITKNYYVIDLFHYL